MLPCGTRYHVHPPPIPFFPPHPSITIVHNRNTPFLSFPRRRRIRGSKLTQNNLAITQSHNPPPLPARTSLVCVSFATIAPFALKPLGVLCVLARDNAFSLCFLCSVWFQKPIKNGLSSYRTPRRGVPYLFRAAGAFAVQNSPISRFTSLSSTSSDTTTAPAVRASRAISWSLLIT